MTPERVRQMLDDAGTRTLDDDLRRLGAYVGMGAACDVPAALRGALQEEND